MIGIGIGVKQRKLGGYGLAKPVATAATGIGQTSFTANWNAYTGAVVYLLDVSASPTFDTFIYENQQVNAPTTSYVVIGLEPNTTYYYRVRASTEALTDPDAQAFFDRVTNAGGSLSATEKLAIDTLVKQMKADGIWTKMKAIYPMVGASAAACAQNLKSSSFTGTFTAGWTFASTGVKGNGSSTFFDTTFKPAFDASLSGLSFGGYLRLNLTTGVQVDGIGVPSFVQHNFTSEPANIFSGEISNIITYSRNPSQRMFIHRRTSATFSESYRDGVSLGTNTSTASSLPNQFFYIGGRNDGGGSVVLHTSQEYAFYFFGLDLTNQNALDFTIAVNTFQTTLSRNV